MKIQLSSGSFYFSYYSLTYVRENKKKTFKLSHVQTRENLIQWYFTHLVGSDEVAGKDKWLNSPVVLHFFVDVIWESIMLQFQWMRGRMCPETLTKLIILSILSKHNIWWEVGGSPGFFKHTSQFSSIYFGEVPPFLSFDGCSTNPKSARFRLRKD